ncbi:MAG TPA: hypothetical protein VFV86_07485 [Nitrososphaeraceae archaeon]|nr:hypothetical protein [Nitrososphaeraceae archaeon]
MRIVGNKYYQDLLKELQKIFEIQEIKEGRILFYIEQDSEGNIEVKKLKIEQKKIIEFMSNYIFIFTHHKFFPTVIKK